MQSQELIKRYVNAVGEHLPKKSRADIQAELTSLLQEQLDARAEAEAHPVDEAMTVNVLREFGDPETVAARYAPGPNVLIGPAYFPLFKMVVRIVAGVMGIVFVVLTALSIIQTGITSPAVFEVIWDGITNYVSGLLTMLGIVVVIFFILERRQAKPPNLQENWNPRALPPVENPNRVNRGEVITSIAFSAVFLVLFNLSPNWMSVFFVQNGQWASFPIFGPGWYQWLPLLSLSFVLDIALNLFVLGQGHWTRVTRIAEIAVDAFGAIVLGLILATPDIAASPTLEPIVRLVLTIVLIIALVVMAINIYQLVTKRWSALKEPGMEAIAERQA